MAFVAKLDRPKGKTKGKTEKQKKINKERKSKGPKISELYNDTSEYNVSGVDIDLTVLRYGMIQSCNVKYVTVGDDTIYLKESWVELILIMMDTLIENYPKNYSDKLSEFNITSPQLSVDTTYGKYTFGKIYKAYKIYDKELFLESTFTYEAIFQALVGLTKALDIGLDGIKFHLVNKNYVYSRLNYSSVKKNEIIVSYAELYDTIKNKSNHLVSMKIFDEKLEVHRMELVLLAFCNIIDTELGEEFLPMLVSNDSTGICTEDEIDGRQSMKIHNTNYYIYSDLDINGMCNFIYDSASKCKFDTDDLKFKFEYLDVNAPKAEWEID